MRKFLFLAATAALAAAVDRPLRITLAGDSTVTDAGGWAPGFRVAAGPQVEITNLAHSGASSESYRRIGDWNKVLATKADYVLIQFGHNDVPGKGPGRETDAAISFRRNIARFVDEARAAGMKPVLVTSVAHRAFTAENKFKFDTGLAPYAEAVRAVAAEKKTPVLDLFALTSERYQHSPRLEVELVGRMLTDKDGVTALDGTHFGTRGAHETGILAAQAFVKVVPEIAPYFRQEILTRKSPAGPGTRWEARAREHQAEVKDVIWTTHEPLSFLLRRGGGNPENVAQEWESQHDPENIRRMAVAGVGYGWLHFYKGLGLAAEKEDIAKTVRAAAIMHQYGMKVSLYMAGTMFAETLYQEIPEAKNWEQRDQHGNWIPYTQTQTYRHYPCYNEPAYREYLQRLLTIAVKEVRADQIMFDNLMLQPEPRSCHCPRCIRAFHDFLAQRYPSKDASFRRFGVANTEWIQAPEWDDPAYPDKLTAVEDPVLQEWVRFRAETLAKHVAALYDFVKKLNPRVSVGFNVKGLYSFNRIWTNAVYHPLLAGHCDMISFDTGGYDSRIDASGALVSQIRSYKMTRSLGISVDETMQDEVHAAVHMAFNLQKPIPGAGVQGGPFGHDAYNIFTPLLEFFREYSDRYFTNTEPVADVAVLRNWPSMAYRISATYIPATLMEQVLIQYKVPFDLLHEEQTQNLARYKEVILAGQEAMSQEQVDKLLDYVRRGGVLLIAGSAGEMNERRERRKSNPFLPARSEGKGRIVVIPRIVQAEKASRTQAGDGNLEITGGRDTGARFSPKQWLLPRNHAEIYRAVVSSMNAPLSVRTEAPLTSVLEMVNRPKARETIVHFINFDRKHPVERFSVTVRKQFPGPVKRVECLSPDANDPVAIDFQEHGEEITFTAPSTRLYSMLIVSQ
jgi:lysophospholipase L1-like esterase